MRLGVDVDDVLFDWSNRAHLACLEAGITNGKQITQWGFQDDYGVTSDVLWDVLYRAYVRGMLNEQPIDGARSALEILQRTGHTIHIVTARGFEGHLGGFVRRETAAWLHDYEIPHDSLTFTKDKTLVAVDVFVDDGPKNVTALEAAGIPTYLMDAIHNQGFEHHARISSITEFATAILLKGAVAA